MAQTMHDLKAEFDAKFETSDVEQHEAISSICCTGSTSCSCAFC